MRQGTSELPAPLHCAPIIVLTTLRCVLKILYEEDNIDLVCFVCFSSLSNEDFVLLPNMTQLDIYSEEAPASILTRILYPALIPVCRDTGPLAVCCLRECVSVRVARNHLPSCLRTIDHCPLCFRQLYETCLIAPIYRNTNDQCQDPCCQMTPSC